MTARIVAGGELNVTQAAALMGTTPTVIKRAIRAGRLPAFLPGGADRLHPGRGMGYRIRERDLRAWWAGKLTPKVPPGPSAEERRRLAEQLAQANLQLGIIVRTQGNDSPDFVAAKRARDEIRRKLGIGA